METKNILIINGIGDCIRMKLLLEQVFGGLQSKSSPIDLFCGRIVFKNRSTCEAKELGVWKKIFDGLMILAELRSMAFVEDKNHSLLAEVREPLLETQTLFEFILPVISVVFAECESKFLNSCHNDLVRVIFGQEALDKCSGIGIFLDAVFLESIEFLTCLAIKIFAIDYEDALANVMVGLEQG